MGYRSRTPCNAAEGKLTCTISAHAGLAHALFTVPATTTTSHTHTHEQVKHELTLGESDEWQELPRWQRVLREVSFKCLLPAYAAQRATIPQVKGLLAAANLSHSRPSQMSAFASPASSMHAAQKDPLSAILVSLCIKSVHATEENPCCCRSPVAQRRIPGRCTYSYLAPRCLKSNHCVAPTACWPLLVSYLAAVHFKLLCYLHAQHETMPIAHPYRAPAAVAKGGESSKLHIQKHGGPPVKSAPAYFPPMLHNVDLCTHAGRPGFLQPAVACGQHALQVPKKRVACGQHAVQGFGWLVSAAVGAHIGV
eukprot:1134246-Pelagomonas_calceolata.AAC.1